MLLGMVTLLIPMIGQLVLSGWHVTIFWARGDDDDPARFPPFDFDHFMKYLERGLWPFLVSLVACFVFVPVIMVLMFGPLLLGGFLSANAGHGHSHGDAFPAVIFFLMFVIYPIFILAFNFLLVPLMLRATITQDFANSFNFGFVKSFLTLVWKELLVTVLYLFGVGLCLIVVTIITCYIGGLLLAPVVIFSWHHLQKQLYQLYRARGGEAVPRGPKLMDLPPPLPG